MVYLKLLRSGYNKDHSVLCLLLFCLVSSLNIHNINAQETVVTGQVLTLKEQMPVPGVSVIDINNPNKGTVTDFDGNYSINVSSPSTTLRFSYVGLKSQDVKLAGQSILNVSMDEDLAQLDEVVVVGYGEQSKRNVTGAVETVRFDGAVNKPVTNSGQLLYGEFSGVQVTQSSGLAGADESSITIRGVGTFGSTNPLVVIDNIQYQTLTEFNNLAPSDIASISVLKDASASAIYGARGANGVIVVTTRRGKNGVMSVDYNTYTGFQQATVKPNYLNAVDYARLRNERDINNGGPDAPLRYSEENIQEIIDGSNTDQYANTNWVDEVLRTAPITSHYLGFTGGNEKTSFRVSLSYLNQDAIVEGKFKSERYTFGLNLSSKIKDWLTLTNVTNAYWDKFKGPTGGQNTITGEQGIINQFQRSAPTVPVFYSNGDYGIVDGSYENVNASLPITNAIFIGQLGNYHSDRVNISDRVGVELKLLKGLSFETSGSLILDVRNISDFKPTYINNDYNGAFVNDNAVNTLYNYSNFNYRLINENILRYGTDFNDVHDLSVLLGHSVIYDKIDDFSGSLEGFPSNAIEEFNGGGILNPQLNGTAAEETLQSFFARVNYSFDGKYLLELNIRRDGSSKFGPDNRYGTFPSASAGWLISEEDFLSDIDWMSYMKIRGSWGKSGNDRIGNYLFQQTFDTSLDYILGENQLSGAAALTKLANSNISWETIEQYDVGLDFNLLKNKLSITADYFKRKSTDILYTSFPIPSTIGITNLAARNAASMENSGIELGISYRDKVGRLNFRIGGNVSRFADNKVTGLGDGGLETINEYDIIRVGLPFRAYYGYSNIGVFQTQEEVDAAPVQFGNVNTAPGDLIYADISGPDGAPDGVVDVNDRTLIGNPYPKWNYNFNLSLEYAGIDFSVLFQGVQDIDRMFRGNGQLPMNDARNNVLDYYINRWTPENPSAALPRLGGQNNDIASSFYIEDASFLRMKNIEVGYSLPERFVEKIGIQKVRVFAGGQNLLTFTKLDNFDPERAANDNDSLDNTLTDRLTPLYKIFTLGLNIKL